MTRIIFVRHGESEGNKFNRFNGNYNGELTERGRMQARAAAEYLKNEKIDIAYASDLARAYETGKIISSCHGIEPIPDRNLREIYGGEWENREYSYIVEKYPESFSTWIKDLWQAKPDGGESIKDLAARIRSEVWRIAEENDGKTVLVATHATPIRVLSTVWKQLPDEDVGKIDWVPNCSVSIAEYDSKNHTVELKKYGEAGFLGELETRLPTKI